MFSLGSKGLYIKISEYGIIAARTSRLQAPFVIVHIDEISLGAGKAKIREFIGAMAKPDKGQYSTAICGVYPTNRILRLTKVEQPSKYKEPEALQEFLNSQFKINSQAYTLLCLNPDGSTHTMEKGASKDFIVCGAPQDEILKTQKQLTDYAIYPQRLEFGSIAMIGGLIDYCKMQDIKPPTISLEISTEKSRASIIHNGELKIARNIPFGLNSMYPILQKELGLKDESSARNLLVSNTFDFTEIGPLLLRKLIKELQASTGYYEVQTGQTIGQVFIASLPDNLAWMGPKLSESMGIEEIKIDYLEWFNKQRITVDESVQISKLSPRWFSLFSLMGQYKTSNEEARD